ncbi:hypothetical protein Q7C36_014589, partial [Tachysurus vachellii]
LKESPMVTECFRETAQIEVIKGSGVFCQAEAWKAARLANSATAMVRNLLLGTFNLETLLKSNLKVAILCIQYPVNCICLMYVLYDCSRGDGPRQISLLGTIKKEGNLWRYPSED